MIKGWSGSVKFRKEIAHNTSEIFLLFIGYSPKFVKLKLKYTVVNRGANNTTTNLNEVQPWNI